VARGLLYQKAMSVYSAQYHAMIHSPPSEQVTVTATKTAPAQGAQEPQDEGFFHRLLDVINPLQHLPLVGTAYRAITGDHMGPVEKVMGDTLYGGLWGAVTSIADVAFEGITGKSFEDTVLGWFSHDGPKAVAAKIAAPKISSDVSVPSADLPILPGAELAPADDLTSFSNALSAKGVNGEMAQRAMYAYRRSMGLTAPVQPVLSSVN
jgi:hypothetical protein